MRLLHSYLKKSNMYLVMKSRTDVLDTLVFFLRKTTDVLTAERNYP